RQLISCVVHLARCCELRSHTHVPHRGAATGEIAALFRFRRNEMKHLSLLYLLICAACEFGATERVYAHGFAGARFFPATLSTDDPFVADELSLPTVSTIRTPEDGGTRETDISVDISKR